MKIISGILKGRKLLTNNDYRPTTSKVKEAIFSSLEHSKLVNDSAISIIKEATTIDLFGGTGALTFEAISRGASKGFIIENNISNLKTIEINANKLGIQSKVSIIKGDATDLPRPHSSFFQKTRIAFIDPPFNKNLVLSSILQLTAKQWLANKSLLIIQNHVKEQYKLGKNYTLISTKKYGKAVVNTFRYTYQ